MKKTHIIVGPGRHFGAQLAVSISRPGDRVIFCSRHEPREVGRIIRSVGREVVFSALDVGQDVHPGWSNLRRIISGGPPLSSVVFNVRNTPTGSVTEVSGRAFTASMNISVVGAIRLYQNLIGWTNRASRVNYLITGGGYKSRPDENRLSLSLAKAALHNLVLALALGSKQRGIDVQTLVIDGSVRPEGGTLTPEEVGDAYVELMAGPQRRLVIGHGSQGDSWEQLTLLNSDEEIADSDCDHLNRFR